MNTQNVPLEGFVCSIIVYFESGPQMRAMPRKRKKRKKLSDDEAGPMGSQNMPTRKSSRIATQPRKQYQEDGNYIDKILEYEAAEHEKSKKEQVNHNEINSLRCFILETRFCIKQNFMHLKKVE